MLSFRTFACAALAASGIVVLGCSGERLAAPQDEIATAARVSRSGGTGGLKMEITPALDTIAVGDSLTLTSKVTTGPNAVVRWRSADTTIAVVNDTTGSVRSIAAGTARIIATAHASLLSEVTDTATVVVIARAVSAPPADTTAATSAAASVSVTPTGVRLTVGQSATLTAQTKDAKGNVLSGQTVTWKSSDTTVTKVGADGVARALKVGTAAVTATVGQVSDTASVTVAAAAVASVSVALNSASLSSGQTTQATATAKDASGTVLSGRSVTWTSNNTSVATVSSTGLVTAIAAGSANITASVEGITGSAPLSVIGTSSTTSSTPATTVPSGAITLSIVRMDGGSGGAAFVSSGVPLAPGALQPGASSGVRVFVGGVEQSVYVEELAGRHKDGSLRSILIEFNVPSLGDQAHPLSGSLVLGGSGARQTADLPKPDVARRGVPQAAVLPTDPAYLARTDVMETPGGALPSVAQVQAMGGAFAQYEANFASYGDQHWTNEGTTWGDDYYDRANIFYAWWVRTGNAEYWRRATLIATTYRHDYLEVNNYASSPHWAQLEGLEKHYLLTGDQASRFAVARVAEGFAAGYMPMLGDTTWGWMDSRVQARVLQAYFLAWRLGDAQGNTTQDWAGLMDIGLTKVIGSQSADGAFRFAQNCYYTQNFMTGLLTDQLIRQHTYYKADARIPVLVKKAVDYMWATQWDAATQSFYYLGGQCDGQGGKTPSPDLNGFTLPAFGWLYHETGDAHYRDAGDQVLAGAVAGAYIIGSKQFNETYTSSFRYFGFRLPAGRAVRAARTAAK